MLAFSYASLFYYWLLVAVLVAGLWSLGGMRRKSRRSGLPMRYARQGTTLRRGTTGSAGDRELRRATREASATRRPPGAPGLSSSLGPPASPTLTMPPPGYRLPWLSMASTTSAAGDASTTRPYGDYIDLSPYWRARLEAHDRNAA